MDKLLLKFKALSDKNRLRTFCALQSCEELCACQIIEFLQVAGATASRHLSLMVNAGLLKTRKKGRWVYFRLNKDILSFEPVATWIAGQIKESDQLKKDTQALKGIASCSCQDIIRQQKLSRHNNGG